RHRDRLLRVRRERHVLADERQLAVRVADLGRPPDEARSRATNRRAAARDAPRILGIAAGVELVAITVTIGVAIDADADAGPRWHARVRELLPRDVGLVAQDGVGDRRIGRAIGDEGAAARIEVAAI